MTTPADGLSVERIREIAAMMRERAIRPARINGEPCYLMTLPEGRLAEAFALGLMPFSMLDGTEWLFAIINAEPPLFPPSSPSAPTSPSAARG